MGAAQMTASQFRINHVNGWLAMPRFNEQKKLSGRMIYQTTNFDLVARPAGAVTGQATGIHPISGQAAEDAQLKKQPQVATQLVLPGDFASISNDPKQVMSDLMRAGWINSQGIISEGFYELAEPAKMNLPLTYDAVSKDIFALLQAARHNYYLLAYDMVVGEQRADNPIGLFKTIDGIFMQGAGHQAVVSSWTGNAGQLRHDLLLHMLSIETPSIDLATAVNAMNAWFKDIDHCPAWAQPGQPNIFHSYDFEVAQGDKSGMAPHSEQPLGNGVQWTHHFKLAARYFASIVPGLENIGKAIVKQANVVPQGGHIRPWTPSSQADFMVSVLEQARFGTPRTEAKP